MKRRSKKKKSTVIIKKGVYKTKAGWFAELEKMMFADKDPKGIVETIRGEAVTVTLTPQAHKTQPSFTIEDVRMWKKTLYEANKQSN